VAIVSETKTIVGVFDSVSEAQEAVRELETQGITRNDISVVANKNAVGYETLDKTDKASDVVADAGIGAAIGGVGGLLLSAAGAITIPVIGPILAAGPIAAALTGAGIGAAAGGLVGALTESGVPEEHAKYYAEGVRRGDVLVTVRATTSQTDRVCDILDRHNAIDVDDRVSNWKERGWAGYSDAASPLREDEMREERLHYRLTGSSDYPGAMGTGYDRSEFSREFRSDLPHHSTSSMGDEVREAGRDAKRAWRDNVTDRDRDNRNDFAEAMDRDKDGRNDIGEGVQRMGDKVKDWGRRVADEGRELRDEVRDKERRVEADTRDEEYRRRRARVYDHIKY
jgi:uncharacterized membrane protein